MPLIYARWCVGAVLAVGAGAAQASDVWHVLKHGSKGSLVVPCVVLHRPFCFCLASLAYPFSRIVHYAPSRSKPNVPSSTLKTR